MSEVYEFENAIYHGVAKRYERIDSTKGQAIHEMLEKHACTSHFGPP